MGTLSYADGDKYVGEWKGGKKSGKGELIYINGDKFRYVPYAYACTVLCSAVFYLFISKISFNEI